MAKKEKKKEKELPFFQVVDKSTGGFLSVLARKTTKNSRKVGPDSQTVSNALFLANQERWQERQMELSTQFVVSLFFKLIFVRLFKTSHLRL